MRSYRPALLHRTKPALMKLPQTLSVNMVAEATESQDRNNGIKIQGVTQQETQEEYVLDSVVKVTH